MRSPRFRYDPFARDVALDPGRASAPRIAVPHRAKGASPLSPGIDKGMALDLRSADGGTPWSNQPSDFVRGIWRRSLVRKARTLLACYALGPPASAAPCSCRREAYTGRSAWLAAVAHANPVEPTPTGLRDENCGDPGRCRGRMVTRCGRGLSSGKPSDAAVAPCSDAM